MLFPSPIFLSVFLPITALACALLRGVKLRNAFLLAASLVFYAWGGWVNALLLAACSFANWGLALGFEELKVKSEELKVNGLSPKVKAINLTILTVIANMGLLAFFKFAPLFTDRIVFPIGISFFTFQAMGYTLDVRAGRCKAARNPFDLLLFICLFPQLIAGPIESWNNIRDQLKKNNMSWNGAARGLATFAAGLCMKVLLADTLAKAASLAFAAPAQLRSAPLAWLGAISYTLQIYFDFAGYSTMAVGLGQIIGINLTENFRTPLAASSIQDFWKRWHITLTGWFRDYIYIPLGGNRRGALITVRNLAVIYLVTGIWHGADLSFIAWGLFNGLFVILERLRVIQAKRFPKWLAHIYVWIIICIGFAMFRAENLAAGFIYIKDMFDFGAVNLQRLLEPLDPKTVAALLIGAAAAVGGFKRVKQSYIGALIGIIICYTAILASGYHPFLYFAF
jgi:alginate O-acetyltransferase complex protein AlgI